ncbi:tetratricopeptide repeat protein [Sandaracinobacter neustonicus]|uniref:Tetratricopeptide repeat protein n=2 Tax=Sandaracinobacter neustonicus TaxID=1715348 RepID=A0A501XLT3_9SPHN|nr:tetratricopeptide repeat protein [Sandaracinobacter neustonicus]
MTIGLALVAAAPLSAAKPRAAVPDAAPARGLPDNQIAPLSLEKLKAGEALLAQGKAQEATDQFEAALAADPRNRQAYIGMARAAEADGLPGKAVRFYREALAIEPNDLSTLELQGVAMVERGAKARAEANLERVKTLCAGPCPQADRLAAAIARGPKTPVEQTAKLDTGAKANAAKPDESED